MTTEKIAVDKVLNTKGLQCPEPVMMLHKAIREIQSDDVIKVLATDPSTQRDIPKFCHFLGHNLIAQHCSADVYEFLIKKK